MAIREVFMPALSSTMTEGKIVSWQKSPGEKVEKGEIVVVVESDKADMDVETFYSGFIATILIQAGESAPVGSAIALVAETEAEIEVAKQQSQGKYTTAATTTSAPTTSVAAITSPVATVPAATTLRSERAVVSPRARKLAKEYGVSVETLNGTGPNGRITAEDVSAAAGKAPVTNIQSTPATPVAAVAPVAQSLPVNVPSAQVVPFNTLQSAVNRNMMASLSVPTFRVGYTIETNNLDKLYKQVKSKGVTMTALLAKAVAMTLAKHPTVNASYSDAGISHPGTINIAVAVTMPDGGLITPVLQGADKLDLYSLSRKWKDLVDRARIKQLQPQEYSSGTFTISNLGMLGVDRFDAILPPGTGAILAVGASHPQVVASEDGTFAIRRQMQVNMTADHRIIYGAEAANFLKDLALLIQTDAQSLTL
jgi:pyruvate dehydrogenase E2 component (dihydrolipoamide acetyltransferase)